MEPIQKWSIIEPTLTEKSRFDNHERMRDIEKEPATN